MIPFILSLSFGLAAYLTYEGLTRPAAGRIGDPRAGRVGAWLARFDASPACVRDVVAASGACGLLAGSTTWLVAGWAVLGLAAGLLAAAAPTLALARSRARRREAVREALVDAIEQLRDAITAGRSVQEALASLAHTGPDALRGDCAALARDMRLIGFEQALIEMRDRVAEPAFDTACASLLLNDRLGGRNVGAVLARLAHATRAQHRVRAEVQAQQARAVLSARVVAATPAAVLVGIRVVDPGYLRVFDGAAGQALLGCCLASMAVGYVAMRWTARLPAEPRVQG